MIRRTSGRCRGLASALLLATLLTACGRDDGKDNNNYTQSNCAFPHDEPPRLCGRVYVLSI